MVILDSGLLFWPPCIKLYAYTDYSRHAFIACFSIHLIEAYMHAVATLSKTFFEIVTTNAPCRVDETRRPILPSGQSACGVEATKTRQRRRACTLRRRRQPKKKLVRWSDLLASEFRGKKTPPTKYFFYMCRARVAWNHGLRYGAQMSPSIHCISVFRRTVAWQKKQRHPFTDALLSMNEWGVSAMHRRLPWLSIKVCQVRFKLRCPSPEGHLRWDNRPNSGPG